MRFVADGPDIPDDLLLARDQGRVVLFAGAGVSRARANLPDFFGLAEKVISKLGVLPTSPAYKLLHAAQRVDDLLSIPGLISADRIFSQLERDFLIPEIEEAVAQALKPASNCDLGAHEVLLDLATGYAGAVRLVTTNFDRLFDACDRDLVSWHPPRLPDPSNPSDMRGIVYLHGKANLDYDGAENGNFVLSSSGFGRAYLSDGWATSFFKKVIREYVVVFVGYAADDPPVQYLLEALNTSPGHGEGAYAFQAGTTADADARWLHKGVRPIAYDGANAHKTLWQTLTAWAARARDVDGWYTEVINHAKKGPAAMLPHERGQVAHVVSTYDGVKRFVTGGDAPPAEWMCVFDPVRRYAKPGRVGVLGEQGLYVDPFDRYGLDSDVPPKKIDPEDHYAKREVPPVAWNGLAITRLDQTTSDDRHLAAVRGTGSAPLVPRLSHLGNWFSMVAWQPAALWWASHQEGLHPEILRSVVWRMQSVEPEWTSEVRNAWSFLNEAWESGKSSFTSDWFALKRLILRDGWDAGTPRRYASGLCPYFKVGFSYRRGPIPPSIDAELGCGGLIQIDVEYPDKQIEIDIPDAWVAATTKALRQNLERALELETELGGYGLWSVSPIIPDDRRSSDDNRFQRTHGLSGAVLDFADLFSRLIVLDAAAAIREYQSWPVDDDTIFARLRIWAAGKTRITSPSAVERVISGLSDTAFWNSYHQRDLLLVLAGRWNDLQARARKRIEKKLLRGPRRRKNEDRGEFSERRAMATLNRLYWLVGQGVSFTQDVEIATLQLESQAPRWSAEYAAHVAESMEGRSGWVRTETKHAALLEEPLSSILSKAEELSGHSEFLVENDPFAGLVAERPVRAFLALLSAARAGQFPEWAWRRFLSFEARKNDGPRQISALAMRLNRIRPIDIAPFVHSATDWLVCVSKPLATARPLLFDETVRHLFEVLRLELPGSGMVQYRGSREPDWAMEALNSPSGKISRALFDDPRSTTLIAGAGLSGPWVSHVEAVLSLGGDQRRQAMVSLFRNLNWFYAVDPTWTARHLLPLMESTDPLDKDAAWAGFLWAAQTPDRDLYLRLKPVLMVAAATPLPSHQHHDIQVLAGLLLAGWASGDPGTGESYISDGEMRALVVNGDDDFRSSVLWQAERWAESADEGNTAVWNTLLLRLIKDVWPRQASVKSPRILGRLCDLALSDAGRFPNIAPLILPLLTRTEGVSFTLPHIRDSDDGLVRSYPVLTLALLDAVLADNVREWRPYGIDEVLQQVIEADKTLKTDARYLRLKRLWDAR